VQRTGLAIAQVEGIDLAIGAPARGASWTGDAIASVARMVARMLEVNMTMVV
jgi:hypothetical protein